MKRLLALLLAAILTLSCCSVVLAEEAAAQDVVTVELALAAKVDHGKGMRHPLPCYPVQRGRLG